MSTLGIVLPMGQSKKILKKSGQWNLWEQELSIYRKYFKKVEVFEYREHGMKRFLEALCMPVTEKGRWISCDIFKAVHLTGSVPCLIGRLVYGKPYFLSYGYRYDQFARIEKKWIQAVLIKLLNPVMIRCAGSIMVPTGALENYVQGIGARKTKVIPNGVDTTLFRGSSSRGRSSKSDMTVLFIGRLEKQKNLEVLIKAIYEASKGLSLHTRGQSFIHIRLTFVGDGSLKQRLQLLARKLNVNLEIKNPVPNNRLPRIYEQADVFILPSLAEGHPKVLLEAMSCGLAIIASDIPGCRDVVTNNMDGLLVKPSSRCIAAAMNKLLLDTDLRHRLGINARKTIVRKYDKELLMQKEISEIKKIISA